MLKIIYFLLLPLNLLAVDLDLCIHFLSRTSFAVDKHNLSSCLNKRTYKDVINDLIYRDRELLVQNPPKCSQKYIWSPKKKTLFNKNPEEIKLAEQCKTHRLILKSWWFNKMLTTDDPFQEKMVLFWHNHFTSSFRKVIQPILMYRQNQLFRKYALGNFSKLLHEIIEDPAMLIYLDNRVNNKNHPNENFARELLELFTLGEGNYDEKDVKELARALTGYSINNKLEFQFKSNLHDYESKKIFTQTGSFNGHQAIDLILQREETSLFIVQKLWLEFIGYKPNSNEIKRLAKLFRQNGYEIKPLMMAFLTSPYFTDSSIRGTMIKSPIELVVGTLRSFGYINFDAKLGIQYSKRLGQDLLNPPNVKGWSGGKIWITANTLLIRKEFLKRLTRGNTIKHLNYDIFQIGQAGNSQEKNAANLLLPINVFLTPTSNFNNTLQTILQHPLYQLK